MNKTEPLFLIRFDDQFVPDELIVGRELALKRFDDISVNWNASMFVMVLCNTNDHFLSKSVSIEALEEFPQYTCIGKGGRYEYLGVSKGAGTSKGSSVIVYRDTQTSFLYHRSLDDFQQRMQILT